MTTRAPRLPLRVRLALFVRRQLPRRDLVERAPLRFHPDVGVPREQGAGDVPGDAHNHLVAGARLREFRDQCVAVIVPPADGRGGRVVQADVAGGPSDARVWYAASGARQFAPLEVLKLTAENNPHGRGSESNAALGTS